MNSMSSIADIFDTMTKIKGAPYTRLVKHAVSMRMLLCSVPEDKQPMASIMMSEILSDLGIVCKLDFKNPHEAENFKRDIDSVCAHF